jgi:hypothetical protein
MANKVIMFGGVSAARRAPRGTVVVVRYEVPRVMRKIAVSAGRLNRSQLRSVVNIAFKRNTWRF